MELYDSFVRLYYKLFVNEHKVLKREKKNPRLEAIHKGGNFLGLHDYWGIIAAVSIFIILVILVIIYHSYNDDDEN